MKGFLAACIAALAFLACGCRQLDNDRIPYTVVNIEMNEAQWNVYGVNGAGDYRIFVKRLLQPSGYPYKVGEETGFGGVLLVMNYYGNAEAFDLACPVEMRYDVRIAVGEDQKAYCAKCGSTYSVFENSGIPLSGPAKENDYGLQRYSVVVNPTTKTYSVVH